MIDYTDEEEKIIALYFAELLDDSLAKSIFEKNGVSSSEEATHLSRFFWQMAYKIAEDKVQLPCEGDPQAWIEKLYSTIGGYLEEAGYDSEWDAEICNA